LEEFKMPGPIALAVGETQEEASFRVGSFILETKAEDIDGFATVGLRVEWPDDESTLPKVKYISVEFKSAEQRELEHQALLAALQGLQSAK
jgi:hypothetical protein